MSRRIIAKPDPGRIMAEVFASFPGNRQTTPLRPCAGRVSGGQCWAPVAASLGSIPVCEQHLAEVKESLTRGPGAGFQAVTRAVVYYLGDPCAQEVKIGTTTRLRARLMNLSTQKPQAVLLATEPGSNALERRRHRQFRTLRSHGEWFRKAPVLMEHIGEVRLKHGILLTGDGFLPEKKIAALRR